MKMVKKILLGLTAAAAVIAFAGCKFGGGVGDTDGTKWDLTMTVDATDPRNPLTQTYRRYYEEFSTNEACAEIITRITINMNECTNAGGVFTTGFIFDCNKNASDASKVDFCLIGISPTEGYYVERYTNVSKRNKTFDSSETQIGTSTNLDGKASGVNYLSWASKGITNTPVNNTYTYTVKISQDTPKTYIVKINDVQVAEYDASSTTHKKNLKKNNVTSEYAIGGIACYGSISNNNKLIVKYHTEKDNVLGTLEAEEIEE